MLSNTYVNKKTIIEYIIIVFTITLFVIITYFLFGDKMKDIITKSSCGLTDGIYVIGDKTGKGYCSLK